MFRTPKLRRLLVVPAAIVAVLTIASSANAAAPAQIDVGTNTTAGTHAVTAANKGSISVTLGALGASCTSATASGTVNSGPHTAGSTYLTLPTLNLNGCTGILGIGVTITRPATCAAATVKTNTTATATAPMTDNPVAGVLDLGPSTTPCMHVQTNGIACNMDIYGQTSANFNENPKSGSPRQLQDLTISGSGLKAINVNSCLGIVNNGDAVTLNITFNIDSVDGLINFKP